MRNAAMAAIVTIAVAGTAMAAVTMEVKPYAGWDNCVYLSNGTVELIITTDVGPRVMRYGFVGGQNLFLEIEGDLGASGADKWVGYGGHRLWHAPEDEVRTYAPDNGPVKHEWNGKTLRLTQPTEDITGIQKQIEITLGESDGHVKLVHRMINRNLWDVTLSPWCLTVMAPGGRGIFPMEDYRPHPEYLLPARPLVLWHYTNMADPRWTWGEKYIQLQQDPKAKTKQKIGLMNKQGWMAYALDGDLFIKVHPYDEDATYPDYGCNAETFTNAAMLELETLGPLAPIPAQGGSVEHTEHWFLVKADVGDNDAAIDKSVLPLAKKARAVAGNR